MIHQPIELGIPSAAKARRRMRRKPATADGVRKEAEQQTAVLIEAIDEAFASLPHSVQAEESSNAAGDPTADLKSPTSSLAGLLATQLQELDQQRQRLAQLLAQIDDRA